MKLVSHSQQRWRQRYRLLLRFYPASYRQNYEASTLQLFDDLVRDAGTQSRASVAIVIRHAFLDTIVSIMREQISVAWRRLTQGRASRLKIPTISGRHRFAFITVAVIMILGTASWLSGFWNYDGAFGYAKRVVEVGMMQERYARSWNSGWDDVTANFVADYIEAKYYGNQRTDVGYQSPHALQDHTYKVQGQTYTDSLERTMKMRYSTIPAGFDPLLCGSQPPVSVRYIREAVSGAGQAAVLAAFTYAGSSQPNLVRYALTLDITGSSQGEWRIMDVSCLSLDAQPEQPYTPSTISNANARAYEDRNNRHFGPLLP